MTVYVDDAQIPGPRNPNNRRQHLRMCHMTADSIEQLHEMADQIGVDRRHFQDKRLPHYDICRSKRQRAVMLGAAEVSSRVIVVVARRLRKRMDA